MITVGVLCEGQTEENMVREFLGPELHAYGIVPKPWRTSAWKRYGRHVRISMAGSTNCWLSPW
jgi:hypothetical protein